MTRHVLILGGTEEAYALAEALAGRGGLRVVTSLAGRTASPRRPAGDFRVGGFGGPGGMAAWLRAEDVAALVDATHPFAEAISAEARAAAGLAGVPLLRLERPAWEAGPGDDWREAADPGEALALLDGLGARRVLAVIGRREVGALAGAPGIAFLLRSVEPPEALPPNVRWVQGRGPFAVAGEAALLQAERINALFCRASGGAGGRAKLDAARDLGLPVVMLRRPAAGMAPSVGTVDAALAWLARAGSSGTMPRR
ncbi:MAG: cobalt-precorrin-6A reductase [Geminicoccaceae bacterium]|nr:cobalt-precorrin-6A reductase [Geminicoccaceae bacterium]